MKFVDARKYKEEVNGLYQRAFPAEERAPLCYLYYRMRTGKSQFYAVLEDEMFVGLVYTIVYKDIVYVFYLAVLESQRGKGYGSRILQVVKKRYQGYKVILNIEDPNEPGVDNYDERMKRLHFYEQNGFQDLHVQTREVDVAYELLGAGCVVTQKEYLQLMKDYLGTFIYWFVFRKTIIQ